MRALKGGVLFIIGATEAPQEEEGITVKEGLSKGNYVVKADSMKQLLRFRAAIEQRGEQLQLPFTEEG